jgi:ATP-dependent Clp protease ATP-binding subunit ClpC
VGFQTENEFMEYREIKSSAMNELKRTFRPEFINRVDEIVVFHSLKQDEVRQILDILLQEVQNRLVEKEIVLEVKKKAKDYLIEHGYDAKYGARPLRRVIQKEIEDPLSMEILRGRFNEGSHIIVTVRNDKISFQEKTQKKQGKQEEAEHQQIATR